MFKRVAFAAAAAATLFAAPVSAATFLIITQSPLEAPCAATSMSCNFTIAGGTDTDGGFTAGPAVFSLPGIGNASSAVTTSVNFDAGGIKFDRIFISYGATNYEFSQDLNTPNTWSVNLPVLGGSYSLTVEGQAAAGLPLGGTFGGNLSFQAVPEPATWALFILGFGAIGGALRRRSGAVRVSKTKLHFT